MLGLAAAGRLRPDVGTLLLGRELVAGIEVMLSAYLDSLTAATPLLAQRAGEAGQKAIDSLSETLHRANARTDVLEILQRGNYLDEGGLNLLDALIQLAPHISLLEIDRKGTRELSLAIGREITTPGLGATHLILKLIADQHMDPEAYSSKMQLAGRLVQQRRAQIADLLSDPDFHSDMAAARSRALRMNVVLDRLLVRGLPDSMLVDQFMDTYRDCLEFFGLPLIAFALRISGRKSASYRSLRSKDVSELAEYCADDKNAAVLIAGYSKAVRHAASHAGTYVFRDGSIHINLRKCQEVIDLPRFIDNMFEFLESCQALMLIAESELPPSAQQANGSSIFMEGMTDAQKTSFILRSCGASAVERVEQVNGTWTAWIAWQGPGLLLLCRAIAQWCPPGTENVRVVADGGARYVEVPLADLQASLTSDLETPTDVLLLLENAKGPTGPSLTTEALRHLAFKVVAEADASIPGARAVKACLRAADRRVDAELGRALRATLVRIRSGDDAIRGTSQAHDLLFFTQLPQKVDFTIP